jgi:hypothetical protein
MILAFPAGPLVNAGAIDVLRAELEQIRYAKAYRVGSVHVTGGDLIADFYE